jgi:flavin reductase (DIM6/NTAB) family NADH-FMN oxidoreductase RutF
MDTELRAALAGHYATLTGAAASTATVDEPHCSATEFRTAMSAMPTGVSLLTARWEDTVWAMTVGSVTSLSLEPPLLLVCLHRASRTLDLIADEGRFAVNVLAADQEHLADRFASPRDRTAADTAAFSTIDGLPVLSTALAVFTCRHEHTYISGDHAIVIGAVSRALRPPGGDPLIRHDSRYRRLR